MSYLGAGIYEELLFRLILITAAVWLIRLWLPDKRKSMVLAVLASSLLFAAAHYVGAAGYHFDWFSFFVFPFRGGRFFLRPVPLSRIRYHRGGTCAVDISVVIF